MAPFTLTGPALRDVADILAYLHGKRGANAADSAESMLFAEFVRIGLEPSAGHRRTDLTQRKLLFHFADPYMVVFRRKKNNAEIVRVLHTSRDLKKLL